MKRRLARRSVSSLSLVGIVACGLLVTSSRLVAGQPRETLSGFSPTSVVEARGIDNIQPYSGDPGVVVPLSPEYPLSPGFSWQLKAYYSVKFWKFDDTCLDGGDVVQRAVVSGYPTLGAGWTLELGYVSADQSGNFAAVYHSPDGGRHGVLSLDPVTGQGVTADGSDLRIMRIPATGTITSYKVEFPDGITQTFGQKYPRPGPVSGSSPDFNDENWVGTPLDRFGLTEIRNSFGTQLLTVSYLTGVGNTWKVNQISLIPQARSIVFTWGTKGIGTSNTPVWPVVSSIAFPAVSSKTLTVEFAYDGSDSPAFWRNSFDESNFTGSPCPTTGSTPSSARVHRLSSITFKDLAGSFTAFSYQFDYRTPNPSWPDDLAEVLDHIVLPTGGTIDYEYGITVNQLVSADNLDVDCPLDGPEGPDSGPVSYDLYMQKSAGVVTRTETVTGVGSSVTTYDRYQASPGLDTSKVTRRVVVTSDGGAGQVATRYVFHTDVDEPNLKDGVELERRHYADANACGTPIRMIVSCYDPEAGGSTICGYKNSSGVVNPLSTQRVSPQQAETTWYGTIPSSGDRGACTTVSGKPCKKASNTQYDAAALKYTTTTVTNKNITSGGPDRTTYTRWTPFIDSTHWLLNLYDEQNETHGTVTFYRGLEFDSSANGHAATAGFLRGTWTSDQPYDPANRSLLLRCRYPNANGTVANEFSKTLATTDLPTPGGSPAPYSEFCSTYHASFPATGVPSDDAFGHVYTWTLGLKKTDKWINGYSGGPTTLPWFAFDVTRDPTTGQITSSRDTAAQQTTYTYDALGRPKTTTPPGEVATSITYDSTTQTTVQRNGGTGLTTWERYIYDGLGRLNRELRQRNNSPASYAVRKRSYDTAGRQFFISEWGSCTSPTGDCLTASPAGTTSSLYDPFDRPGRIVGPNNATYQAINRADGTIAVSDTLETVTGCVNGTWNGTACTGTGALSPQTITRRDVFGRVVSVKEPPSAEETTYAYDGNDKLISVFQGSQTRTFTYDAFGNLRREQTPDKGTVDSTGFLSGPAIKFGSLGNVRQRTDGYGTGDARTHDYTYDPAGRLKTDKVGTTQYVMNCYDGSAVAPLCPDGITPNFSGGTSPKGKLTRQVSTNPLFVPFYPPNATTETWQEDYTYSGLGGRLFEKAFRMQTGAVDRAVESWTYNTLGLVSIHKHPRVRDKNLSASSSRGSFQEAITYTYGLPTTISLSGTEYDNTTIPAATVTTSYHAAGNLASYTASQGGTNLITSIEADLSGLPRPRSISTNLGGFSTGTYAYDAAGNVMAAGADVFKYDARSRLISALYSGQPTTCTDSAGNTLRNQCFAYDRYANLTGVTGTNPRPLTTSASTNRLSSGTYDGRGNLKVFSPDTMSWDDANRMVRQVGGGVDWQYLYNGSGERMIRETAAASGLPITRRDAARYITQAKVQAGQWSLTSTACVEASRTFTDVHCNDPDWDYIQTFYEQGVSTGCGGGNFCPETVVTKDTWAVLLLKAENGSAYVPPACTGIFNDVACPSTYANWIERVYAEGAVGTCGPNLYCPTQNVSESQTATSLATPPNQDLDNPGFWPSYHGIPGNSLYTLRGEGNRLVTEFSDEFASRDNVFLGNLVVASHVPKQPGAPPPAWHFHSSDHLGSVRLTVQGSDGAMVESHKYWPYGDEYNAPISQRLGFAAMERDSEAAHFYDHARSHDFNLGRFASTDTLGGWSGNPQSWNRYSYVLGNPLLLVDRDGMLPSGGFESDFAESITVTSTYIPIEPWRVLWDLREDRQASREIGDGEFGSAGSRGGGVRSRRNPASSQPKTPCGGLIAGNVVDGTPRFNPQPRPSRWHNPPYWQRWENPPLYGDPDDPWGRPSRRPVMDPRRIVVGTARTVAVASLFLLDAYIVYCASHPNSPDCSWWIPDLVSPAPRPPDALSLSPPCR